MAKDPAHPKRMLQWHDPDQGLELWAECDRLESLFRGDHNESRSLWQLYESRPEHSPEEQNGNVISWDGLRKVGFNITAEAIDASASRVCKPLQARLLTVGATPKVREGAKQANRFIDGCHNEHNLNRLGRQLYYDSKLTCTAIGVAIWENDGDDNLRPTRLDPFTTHVSARRDWCVTTRYMTRREAKALWARGTKADAIAGAIDDAGDMAPEAIAGVDSSSSLKKEETIRIREGWIIKRGKAKGRHVVQLDKDTLLLDEEYKHPVLPIFTFKSTLGLRDGESGPTGRMLAPFAFWINGLEQKLYTQIKAQVPHVVAEVGTRVTAPSDVPFAIWRFQKGKPEPKVTIPQTVSTEVVAHLDRLHDGALRVTGLNEASAEGTIPPGVKSGLAIQEYRSEIAIRLSGDSYGWADMWRQSALVLCYLAPELYKSKGARVRAYNSDLLEEITWPSLPENSFTVTVQVAGALPSTVSGNWEALNTFQESGVVDAWDVAEQWPNPDPRALLDRKLARRRRVQAQINNALDDAEISDPPDETQDAAYAVEAVADAIALAKLHPKLYERKGLDALTRLYFLFRDRKDSGASQPETPTTAAPIGAPPAGSITGPPTTGAITTGA